MTLYTKTDDAFEHPVNNRKYTVYLNKNAKYIRMKNKSNTMEYVRISTLKKGSTKKVIKKRGGGGPYTTPIKTLRPAKEIEEEYKSIKLEKYNQIKGNKSEQNIIDEMKKEQNNKAVKVYLLFNGRLKGKDKYGYNDDISKDKCIKEISDLDTNLCRRRAVFLRGYKSELKEALSKLGINNINKQEIDELYKNGEKLINNLVNLLNAKNEYENTYRVDPNPKRTSHLLEHTCDTKHVKPSPEDILRGADPNGGYYEKNCTFKHDGKIFTYNHRGQNMPSPRWQNHNVIAKSEQYKKIHVQSDLLNNFLKDNGIITDQDTTEIIL